MSLSKEKREIIKQYILERIARGDGNIAQKTAESFGITSNSVYRYLKDLTNSHVIGKEGKNYRLIGKVSTAVIKVYPDAVLGEDVIYNKYIDPCVNDLNHNIQDIWRYCFTEMMNNAIDHSQATEFFIYVNRTYIDTTIVIHDNGIGIFRKIREYFNLPSNKDVFAELFKGKLTTDKEHHTGEGIFFTSKILDTFAAVSDGTYFTHNKFADITRDLEEIPKLNNAELFKKGTTILMQLSNFTRKTSKDVFDIYASVDGGFTKTSIPLKYIYDTYPVSRSQAKRLTQRFDSFEEVVLDFSDVKQIGQGFAHELFSVYHNQHKNIRLSVINENEEIRKMIHRVTIGTDS